MDKKKQAPAILLTLNGQSREAALELDIADLNCDNGVKNLMKKLDDLYLKDSQHLAYEAYEEFEKYCRPAKITMSEYTIEFERRYNKTKNYGMELPEGVLAYRYLNGANISEAHKQLVRATLTELKYTNMKEQLKKIFSDPTNFMSSVKEEPKIKIEEGLEVEDIYYQSHRQNYYRGRGGQRGGYRGYNRGSGYNRGGERGYTRGRGYNPGGERKKNPLDKNGEVSRCSICGSIFHWARFCPDSYEAKEDRGTNAEQVKETLIEGAMDVLI